jgi:MtN3 and saliva related transmembrane protein
MLEGIVGTAASVFTTISYFPQLRKAWRTRATHDLSLRMLLVLTTGLSLWVAYGVIKSDWMIIIANSISIACLAVLIYFKVFSAD